jgi:hypothetical protein
MGRTSTSHANGMNQRMKLSFFRKVFVASADDKRHCADPIFNRDQRLRDEQREGSENNAIPSRSLLTQEEESEQE